MKKKKSSWASRKTPGMRAKEAREKRWKEAAALHEEQKKNPSPLPPSPPPLPPLSEDKNMLAEFLAIASPGDFEGAYRRLVQQLSEIENTINMEPILPKIEESNEDL